MTGSLFLRDRSLSGLEFRVEVLKKVCSVKVVSVKYGTTLSGISGSPYFTARVYYE